MCAPGTATSPSFATCPTQGSNAFGIFTSDLRRQTIKPREAVHYSEVTQQIGVGSVLMTPSPGIIMPSWTVAEASVAIHVLEVSSNSKLRASQC